MRSGTKSDMDTIDPVSLLKNLNDIIRNYFVMTEYLKGDTE